MQIFVKLPNGQTRPLDVAEDATVSQVKAQAIGLVFPGRQIDEILMKQFFLKLKSDFLLENRPLASYGITKGTTLFLAVSSATSSAPQVDETVMNTLRQDLQVLMQAPNQQVLFISIASYDNGGEARTIKQQQCPDALLTWCLNNGVALRVLLIDHDFAVEPSPINQIYTIDPQWGGGVTGEAGNKVKRYSYNAGDCRLWAYGTDIPLGETGTGMNSLAGLSVQELIPPIQAHQGCILIGYFHENEIYIQGGDPVLLQTVRQVLGF